jgi:hypothetical protein
MAKHYIALTIDTDPDGLNTHDPDRRNLVWDGLHFAMEHFHHALPDWPLTWYVRADGQLEYVYGTARYLLDQYADFWHEAIARGDELGWHPHLYTVPQADTQPQIITDNQQALSELQRIWAIIQDLPFDLPTFRMGEAWHTIETLNLIESLGFKVDSTAIPGRDDSATGHPRNWKNAPNQPYYPAQDDICRSGEDRLLLEVPMNSWYFQASYDKIPRLRYMNPCIHTELWEQALDYWEAQIRQNPAESYLWVLILHPAEAMPHDHPDLLYAFSVAVLRENLARFAARITKLEHQLIATTMFKSSQKLRKSN